MCVVLKNVISSSFQIKYKQEFLQKSFLHLTKETKVLKFYYIFQTQAILVNQMVFNWQNLN